ncbi:AAA family ATPase [Cellvibrio japonicus]|uniref:RloA protein n=1 Tax=Cellvibrio japonicus (strain Ueda107) TaxID=498211 RepID=B3PE74_CELJU|nr:ATP-binding protein [Cellvibrio japonicus]ACE85172.1 RloA protein [Cellvibrio japonicus Ueda107]QEI12116.1 ATP-binding protein [Cellvibrio japonicus]QEI15690.1 ATP-binding protein [Cellvibrio japonicus]QEI19268.1 ATP-binding protein [Cellvibrio japonicus]
MLIEFSVANFRSFKERQTLSLTKANGQELSDTNTFRVEADHALDLLKSTAIYGPNAGGKTNLLLAVRTMKDIVLHSANKQHGDALPVNAFRLDNGLQHRPSELEILFIAAGVRYQYGFTATQQQVYEEWLIAYPNKRPQRWFSRAWNETRNEYDWEFGSHLTGTKQLWQKSTRDNALFLSTAVQLNSQQLQPLYDWFKNTLKTGQVGGWGVEFSALRCTSDDKSRILDFLKAADLGIADIHVETKPFDPNELPSDMPELIKDQITKAMKGEKVLEVKTLHQTNDGALIPFDLEDESDGTQRFFGFAGPWLDVLKNGYILFIDELHDNLHPKLVQFLVQLFHNETTNPHNAQLIFTTHETSILNQDVFRRDQIWFCEKDKSQASNLYSLTDFSPRKGRENLELAYLSGRYGALPLVGSLSYPVNQNN